MRDQDQDQNTDDDEGIIRIFISSTFQDFAQERDILAQLILPEARAYAISAGFSDLVGVDLRWGVTQEEAENGETLDICLREIDRCRPNFIGLLGERSGWIPTRAAFNSVSNPPPWLEEMDGASITAIEIRHALGARSALETTFVFTRRTTDRTPAVQLDEIPRLAKSGQYTDLIEFETNVRAAMHSIVDAATLRRDNSDSLSDPVNHIHTSFARARGARLDGRDDILDRLDDWARSSAEPRLLILGPPGIGKSAVAAHFAAQFRDRGSASIFEHYLDASSDAADPEVMLSRCHTWIASELGKPKPEKMSLEECVALLPSALESLSEQLSERDSQAILIFDGVDVLGDLADMRWVPASFPPRISMLVTSAEETSDKIGWHRTWRIEQLDQLDRGGREDMIVGELRRYGKNISSELKEQIASHALIGTPLFLKTFFGELQVVGSFEHLTPHIVRLLETNSIEGLLEDILNRVAEEVGERPVSQLLLTILIGRAGVEESVLHAVSDATQRDWQRVRYGLADLIQERAGRLVFSHNQMHVAVTRRFACDAKSVAKLRNNLALYFADSEDVRRWAEEVPWQNFVAEDADALKATFLRMDRFLELEARGVVELLVYWRYLEEQDPDLDQDLRDAVASFCEEPTANEADKVDVALTATRFLRDIGKIGPSLLSLADTARSITQAHFGPNSKEALKALTNLGLIHNALGDRKAAKKALKEAVTTWRSTAGTDVLETALAELALATVLGDAGEHIKAEALERSALITRTNRLGKDHQETIDALENLSVTLEAQGRRDEAISILHQTLEARQRTHGDAHPKTQNTRTNLAVAIAQSGQHAEALPIFETALAHRRQVFGTDHPMTVRGINNVAITKRHLGELEEAEALFLDVLMLRERLLGKDHPDTQSSRDNVESIRRERLMQR